MVPVRHSLLPFADRARPGLHWPPACCGDYCPLLLSDRGNFLRFLLFLFCRRNRLGFLYRSTDIIQQVRSAPTSPSWIRPAHATADLRTTIVQGEWRHEERRMAWRGYPLLVRQCRALDGSDDDNLERRIPLRERVGSPRPPDVRNRRPSRCAVRHLTNKREANRRNSPAIGQHRSFKPGSLPAPQSPPVPRSPRSRLSPRLRRSPTLRHRTIPRSFCRPPTDRSACRCHPSAHDQRPSARAVAHPTECAYAYAHTGSARRRSPTAAAARGQHAAAANDTAAHFAIQRGGTGPGRAGSADADCSGSAHAARARSPKVPPR